MRQLGPLNRRFPATDMPTWLMLALVALGLPRTVLEDLDIVAPGSSLLYYILALTPFAVWLVVAILRRSSRPFADFLVLGLLYGLSLVLVHQVLWEVGPDGREVATRAYSAGIAMMIGVGTGLVAGLVALGAHRLRASRARRATPPPHTPR